MHSARVRARAARERLRASSCAPSETANLLAADRSGDGSRNRSTTASSCCSMRTLKLLTEAAVFLVHNTLGYALMLSVMLFNGYVFVVVVLGMGLGYFLFGHVAMRINMENMQARTTKVICSPAYADGECGLTNAWQRVQIGFNNAWPSVHSNRIGLGANRFVVQVLQTLKRRRRSPKIGSMRLGIYLN